MSDLIGDSGYPASGCEVNRPLKIRMLRFASLLLAVAGLILLYLFSINREIPMVKIGDITPTMNFAYVRISGDVTRDASIFKTGGVVFNVQDSTGEIAVMGGRAQADALQASGKLPRRGDQVEVAGSLSVSADQEVKLRLQSSEQLTLNRKRTALSSAGTGTRLRLADVNADYRGRWASITGTLKSVTVPGPGAKTPYILILEEDGAALAVVFWNDVFQGLNGRLPVPGKLISARGKVDIYRDTIQLKVQEAGDLRVMEPRP